MSEQAKSLIAQNRQQYEAGNHEAAKRLELGNCGLTDLQAQVPELFELGWLEELVLSNEWDLWNEGRLTQRYMPSQNSGSPNKLHRLPAALAKLSRLRVFVCGGDWVNTWDISDMSPIQTLKHLQQLNLSFNKITEIANLDKLTKLQYLDLRDNQIWEIAKLSKLSNLRQLTLSNNKITDIANLGGLTNLQQLGLSSNKITAIANLDKLPNLQDLYLSGNQITAIDNLDNLPDLQQLDLNYNKITEIANLGKLLKLQQLNLIGNQISKIENLDKLTNLQELNLMLNQISKIENLDKLTNLQDLDLTENQLIKIENLDELKNLQKLHLSKNKITEIANLDKLPNLQRLYLTNNKITDLKPLLPLLKRSPNPLRLNEDIRVDVNPLTTPPIEIVAKGHEAVLSHFEDLHNKETVPNDEVKMILIGNSTAGKSSLSLFLRTGEYDKNKPTTHGMEITHVWEIPYSVDNPEPYYKVKIWDFGGQEYYHATHRLFLSRNAVYVLLWEEATNQGGTIPTKIFFPDEKEAREVMLTHYHYEYWLKTIRYYVPEPDTSIFLVQNKTDLGSGQVAIDQKTVNIPPDCIKAISIEKAHTDKANPKSKWVLAFANFEAELNECLQKEISKHPVVTYWFRVRNAVIKEAQVTNQMSIGDFEDFCRQHAQETSIDFDNLLTYLRDTSGLVLYYPNIPSLKDTVFINPNWVCSQIYRILDYSVQEKKGEFDFKHVVQKMGNEAQAKQFITLMQQFELIFEQRDQPDAYIAPQYLPEDTAKRDTIIADWGGKDLAFKVRYPNYMPPHLIVRLIAHYGNMAIKEGYWKQGIAFSWSFKTPAIVEADYTQNEIALYFPPDAYKAETVREVFYKIKDLAEADNFELILGGDDATIEWQTLEKQYRPDKDIFTTRGHVPCRRFAVFFEQNNHSPNKSNQLNTMSKTLNVFISYSPKDEAFKEALDGHATMLKQNKSKIAKWEGSQVMAGYDLSEAIQKLQAADLIIILASVNYLANDKLWNGELQQAMQRHHNKTARIVPIKIKAFNADDVPFGSIQGLPRQGVVGSPDNDEAWTKIVNELKLVVDDMLKDGLGTDTSNNTPASNNTPPPQNTTHVIGNGNITIQGVENSNINIGGEKIGKDAPPPPPKKTILFLAANPENASRLQTDKEYRIIKAEMERGRHRDQYEFLLPQLSLTITELLRAMNDKPYMVHFSGHGTQEGIVIVTDDNKHQIIPDEALKRLFKPVKGSTEIVLLNACHSAAQAKIISALGMYVIGNNLPIGDNAAISFAKGLYVGLGEGKTLEMAYNDAIATLSIENLQYANVVEVWKDGVKLDW